MLCAAPTTVVKAQVGSGKTTVLVHKLLAALACGAVPERVAVLTFSTHAARELRQRVARALGDEVASRLSFLGTFHAIALAILRRRRARVEVIDPEVREDLWRELIAAHGLRVCYRKRLERRLAAPRARGSRFGAMKRPDDLARLEALYCEHKRARGLYDFDDLLREARAELLEAPLEPPLEWVLIDELQDTSHEQLRLLDSLAAEGTRWFAVGDPNQVIYSWRGNAPQSFALLGRRPGAVTLELPQNYRSTATILRGAEHVLPGRRLVATRDCGAPLRLLVHHDTVSEARYLSQRLPELARDGWHEVGILARTRRQLAALELALRGLGVPVHSPPPRPSLAVRWVRRLLQSALTPALPGAGSTAVAAQLLGDEDYGLLAPRLLRRAPGSWEALLEFLRRKRPSALPVEEQGALKRAIRLCARLAELPGWLATEPPPSADDALVQLELAEAIGPTRARYPEDLRRVRAALEAWFPKLLDVAPDRRAEALAAELCADPAPAPPALRGDADGVRLLTFHGAKGLEFRHLLLSGLNAGLVPLARAAFKPTELREERRLFYVALTRAKDTLELSYHRQPDRPDVAGEPSPFLAELTTVTPDLARPPASGERPFARGDVVEHRRYGSGEVLEAGARVRVRFAGGARTFLPRLAVACLSRADADTGAPTSGA